MSLRSTPNSHGSASRPIRASSSVAQPVLPSSNSKRGRVLCVLRETYRPPQRCGYPKGSCAIARGDRFGGGKVAATGGAVVGLKVRHTPDGVVAGDRLVDLGGSTIKVTDGKITDQKAISAFLASPEYVAWKMSEAGEDPALPWFLANPREIAVVPPGALGRIEAGKACLGTPTGAVAVDVLGSSMGQSFVATADGAVPRQVLARATPELECS